MSKPLASSIPPSLPPGIKAALIDMDGVLFDSMPFHAASWHRLFTELGVTTSRPEEYYLYEGMKGSDTIGMILKRELDIDTTEEERREIYAKKAELFKDCGQAPAMPGAAKMLAGLKKLGIDTYLVTGSAQGSLLDNLDSLYPGFFPKEKRITALDVKNGKPHPEPYLRGVEKAGVDPSQAIVIENAPLGVRAGKAAGLFTIAVTTGPIPAEAFVKEKADIIFPDMISFADWLHKI
ncbi:MAG: HAD-IA family hydrolase [Muribaculaceae bacterium]|nr:HAD-IA family hydrolase [Muribaculaceae bacterium]